MPFKITGLGKCLPKFVLDNHTLGQMVDSSDEWISQMTGIKERRIITDETMLELAAGAAANALMDAGVSARDLDLIICATIKGENTSPALSCLVQKAIGASCPAFDVNGACSGFVYALDIASSYFYRPRLQKILVVGVDLMSEMLDWTDRQTCVLFGDGAAAALLERGEGVKSLFVTAAGDDSMIKIPTDRGHSPFLAVEPPLMSLTMAGKEVFKFAVHAIKRDLQRACQEAGITPQELDLIIPHQANNRIIYTAASALGIPYEKFFLNINKYGNTAAASIPLAMTEAKEAGLLSPGKKIALISFGGGMTSGVCILVWE
jgi:3-oxoacyl-[acyl-carrier-protein] synthase-3